MLMQESLWRKGDNMEIAMYKDITTYNSKYKLLKQILIEKRL